MIKKLLTILTCSLFLNTCVSRSLNTRFVDEISVEKNHNLNFDLLKEKALNRAFIYEKQIEQRHLWKGLIIDLNIPLNKPEDVCDSLIFSSLHFVALNNLNMKEQAKIQWDNIKKYNIKSDGRIIRHPYCQRKSLSRDQIIGLFLALTFLENEKDRKDLVKIIVERVKKLRGFFDDGRIDQSYLTPGLKSILGALAYVTENEQHLNNEIKDGFSTLAFDSAFTPRGYQANLTALCLLLEMLLSEEMIKKDINWDIFNFEAKLFSYDVNKYRASKANEKRWQQVASYLVALDDKNLFFRYVYYKAHDRLTKNNKALILDELLKMPIFPENRLPCDMDRHADYAWQRDSIEYSPDQRLTECVEEYSGVDFLLLTSLLLKGE